MNMQDEIQNTPQPEVNEALRQQRNDALFDALGKSKKAKRRRFIRTILILILVAAVVLTAVVFVLRKRVQNKFASGGTDVLSHVVQTGTISTLVSGSGILTDVDTEELSVVSGVELTEILVENGDQVEENQLLAIADMATVRTTMSDLQDAIDALDDQIADADGDTASTTVNAGVPGRLKVLYGEAGMKVADVMVEHGALAVLSLDGYMALDLESDTLVKGDAVSVLRENGKTLKGLVESNIDGTAVILVTDNGPKNEETVTVTAEDGTTLGEGSLYIHKPLMVTAYAGTIRTVHMKENDKVKQNTKLFTLKDTEYSANYDRLLRDRKDSEETLLDLLNIQKYGGITAPTSGSVYNVADLDETDTVTTLATLSPDREVSVTINVDESDILSLELGQETNVTVSSVTEDVLTGIVTEVDKTASSGAYTAVITLDKIEGMLPGMTADVDVKIQGAENALLVPAAAINYSRNSTYVYTSYDEALKEYGTRADVVIGLSNDDYVEIISGLSVGDTVYYTEPTTMFDVFSAFSAMGGGMGGGQMPNAGSNRGPAANREGSQMPGGRG